MNEAKKVSCNKWEDDKRIRGLIGYMIFFFLHDLLQFLKLVTQEIIYTLKNFKGKT